MKSEEIRDLGKLAGAALGGTAARIYDMHEGIAGRVFGAIGPVSSPVRTVHDLVAPALYRGTSTLTAAGVRLAAELASVRQSSDAESIDASRSGRLALGALNGAFGDVLEESGNRLALTLALRSAGRTVDLTRDALAAAYPGATPRIAVFVHGLCETDESWAIGSERHTPYGSRLRDELGYTPLHVRYNSGRHISENGRDLSQLLGDLVTLWPVDLDELTLVGHSMGALVSRSACHYGREEDWVSRVRNVLMLGAPHRGAPLEQITVAASAALERLPETRMFARALNLRSAGVKDLCHGYLVEEDWACDVDVGGAASGPASLRATGGARERTDAAASDTPFLPGANHYFVSATVSREPDALTGRLVGDLLVKRDSAWATGPVGEPMRFPADNYRDFGGINHFDLLNHPAVYEQIKRWLGARRELEAGVDG